MMTRLKGAIGVCVLTSAFLPLTPVQAVTYYVASTGTNSNPGTETQPWQTVAHAVSKMQPGDTTYVRAGTYSNHIRFGRSGTQAAPIKLVNYPDEFPVIDCNNVGKASVLIQHASGTRFPMGYITIEGFEIRNCFDGIKFSNLHDAVISRNKIHDNINQGILGNGTRILIERNLIYANGNPARCAASPSSCSQEHGIYANGTAFTVTNNIIYDNMGNGIQVNGSSTTHFDPSKHAGPEFALSHNWIIANNTFAYQRYATGVIIWGGNCDNLRIENNIFYENGVNGKTGDPQGVSFLNAANSTGVTIRNNHFYASGSGRQVGILESGRPLDAIISDNVINVSSPVFVDGGTNSLPATPNFALTAKSPAIDAGLSLAEIKIAFDGTLRPQQRAHDIGAYEYKAGSDSTHLANCNRQRDRVFDAEDRRISTARVSPTCGDYKKELP